MNENTESLQFSMFKDCFARKMLDHPEMNTDPNSDTSGLDEFASYLALESWRTLPMSIKDATHETKEKVPDADSISLESTSTAFVDTLISYGLVEDIEDALKLLRKVLGEYLEQACAPPPVWGSTRTRECEICDREVPLTYHHLIPRSVHSKVLKKGWHSEAMINSVAWLCRPCHSVVHHVASNEDLARSYYTLQLLLEREDVQKWQKYAAKQRFGVRRG
ncbi:hypothetical protein B0H34DRAFT_663602 [Crassisporium funariophilum]|nr:hypothetical protein B0H34DRAFT_663602 [Crassisporium funariophilum]